MESLKIIQLLKTFDKQEIKDFCAFVQSPYFNKRKTLSVLLNELIKYHPSFEHKSLTKENIYIRVFKGSYNEQILKNLFTGLYKLAEDYLSYSYYGKDKILVKQNLLTELSIRGLNIQFNKIFKNIRAELYTIPVKDGEYYIKDFELEKLLSRHLDRNKNSPLLSVSNKQEAEERLLKYFLFEIAGIYGHVLNKQKLYPDFKFEFNFLDEIKSYMDKNASKYDNDPMVLLYYKIILLLQYGRESIFDEIREILIKNSDNLDTPSKYNAYAILDNFCQSKIFSGENVFLRKKFEINKEQLLNDSAYGASNYLDNIFYHNAVKCSLQLKEFEWCEKFIKEYKDELSPYYKISSYGFCKSLYHYYKKEYDTALDFLAKVQYEDFAFKLEVKALMMMIYYDINDTEPFLSVADSFRHYLSNNREVSERYKTIYLNFLNYSQKLFHLKERFNEYDILNLEKELINTANVGKKYWLNEKIAEIRK